MIAEMHWECVYIYTSAYNCSLMILMLSLMALYVKVAIFT